MTALEIKMTHCNLPFSCDCSTTYPFSACREIHQWLLYSHTGVKLVNVSNFTAWKKVVTREKLDTMLKPGTYSTLWTFSHASHWPLPQSFVSHHLTFGCELAAMLRPLSTWTLMLDNCMVVYVLSGLMHMLVVHWVYHHTASGRSIVAHPWPYIGNGRWKIVPRVSCSCGWNTIEHTWSLVWAWFRYFISCFHFHFKVVKLATFTTIGTAYVASH